MQNSNRNNTGMLLLARSLLTIGLVVLGYPTSASAQEVGPAITEALSSPEALWKFVIAPETPHGERMAAASRSKEVIPLAWMPRLLAARRELADEKNLHRWGVKAHPYNAMAEHLKPWPEILEKKGIAQSRMVLGHRFELPKKQVPNPSWTKDDATAPWPWQVSKAVDRVFFSLLPDTDSHGIPDVEQAERWLDEVMRLPCTSDREADNILLASRIVTHHKNLQVLAAWRNIALNPHFPRTAVQVTVDLANTCNLWASPRPRLVCQAIALDILERSDNERLHHLVLSYLPSYSRCCYPRNGPEQSVAATLILKASKLILKPDQGNSWNRLNLAASVAKTLDKPLFEFDPRMGPSSPKVEQLLADFATWFEGAEAELERRAAEEQELFDSIQQQLSKVDKCAGSHP